MTRVEVGGFIGGVLAVGVVVLAALTGAWPFDPSSIPSILTSSVIGGGGVLIGAWIAEVYP